MSGRVFLVGAGPGDPDLLTLRACRLIQASDVLVYDRLVSKEILDLAPADATRIDVGKQPRHHPVPQEEINALLVRLARDGRTVLRLKGGDPLMFGRGGEEALALEAAGVSYEIIPGITSAQGAGASAMIPLTHRGVASGVRYLTGNCRADAELDYDWAGLADMHTTLVIYMGLANISKISSQLILHGRSPKTPVLAISKATRADETRLVSTLEDIPGATARVRLKSPVLFIVGEVVSLAKIQDKARDGLQTDQLVAAE
jgi:uroporphyrin-III C-methyltransferase